MGVIVVKPSGAVGAGIIKESAIGTPNGVLTVFETSENYYPASLTVYLNGVRERFITELGGKQFSFSSAPRTGFVIDVEYVRR